jgi:clan AA aspartic protease
MMTGRIDEFGRALLKLSVYAAVNKTRHEIEVWVDTGFTGEIVAPESLVKQLSLPQSSMVAAALADGSQSVLETFSCFVDWFGESRVVEVVSSQSRIPLLGVGLLLGRRLIVDYEQLALSIE